MSRAVRIATTAVLAPSVLLAACAAPEGDDWEYRKHPMDNSGKVIRR